jgi:hypothetical protein
MMKVYIAGPMTGLPFYNYPAFQVAAVALDRAGYEVLTPVHDGDLDEQGNALFSWQFYLRRALKMVTDADALALLPGWENSKGANLEKTIADGLGLPVKSLAEWLAEASAPA